MATKYAQHIVVTTDGNCILSTEEKVGLIVYGINPERVIVVTIPQAATLMYLELKQNSNLN